MFSGGICDYKFIIPNNYKDLGLKYNIFKKESENIYYYKNDCPDVQINDIIRFAPIEKNWKANISLYLESTKIITYGKILFPRYYRGGKIRNKYYKIFTYDNIRLKESEIIDNEINLKAEFTLPNKTEVGVDFYTAFKKNLNEEFSIYSEKVIELKDNIDEIIANKVQEIIIDPNSEYKDYPNYYK